MRCRSAAGVASSFLIFASYDNRAPVCDALSPVFLSDALLGGALMYGLAWLSPADWKRRLALALAAGAVIAGFHASMWPQCLQKPEHISPEAQRLWMSYVKEARPVYRHGWRVATLIVALPVTGAIGWCCSPGCGAAIRDLLRRIIGVAAPGFVASLLLLWQTRTGPAAQMLAAVGAAALAWIAFPFFWRSKYFGGCASRARRRRGRDRRGRDRAIRPAFHPRSKADACESGDRPRQQPVRIAVGLHPIALEPKGLVFTYRRPRAAADHADAPRCDRGALSPQLPADRRHHERVARQRGAGAPDHLDKYHANYVLSCPKSSTTTIFMSEAPKGFYGQLERGQVPKWLQPVPLPKDSPFKMWRVVG